MESFALVGCRDDELDEVLEIFGGDFDSFKLKGQLLLLPQIGNLHFNAKKSRVQCNILTMSCNDAKHLNRAHQNCLAYQI